MDQTQLRSPDVYGRTFQMDRQTLDAIATRLEARGQHPFFRRVIDEYMTELALAGPEAILDLGCGTGVAARAIARRPEMRRPITAIDISAHLVAAGQGLARAEGLDGRVDFRVGDAHNPGLAEGGFDVVVMHTLVSHVADPAEVLAKGRRLLRPGSGRLVVFDGDYASFTFATDAPDGGEATDRAVQAMVVANPRVMRIMPRLLAETGFDLLWSRGYLTADIGRADFFASSIASFRVLLPKAGTMSEAEAAAFADALERASAEGLFSARAISTPTWRAGTARPRRGGRNGRGRRAGADAAAAAADFVDHPVCHTGDVATIDPHGFIALVDRSKDVIKPGGEWISSITLENIAVSHPDVAEAAVIAARHPKWMERPLLLLVPKQGRALDIAGVLALYRDRVPNWWLPDAVLVVDELPHTATGKLNKLALRLRYERHLLAPAIA